MSLNIKIQTDEDEYFKKLLIILGILNPFNKLSALEKDIYAELLLLNHQHRKIAFDDRNKLIFNKENKEIISRRLDISMSRVDLALSKFRKVGLIVDKELVPKYIISKVKQVIFSFSEDEDEE